MWLLLGERAFQGVIELNVVSGVAYSNLTGILIRKGNLDPQSDTRDVHTEKGLCEDIRRRWPTVNQGEGPQENTDWPTLWS